MPRPAVVKKSLRISPITIVLDFSAIHPFGDANGSSIGVQYWGQTP